MVLCLEPYSLDQPDSQDVNRGRKYLLDVAGRHGCAVHDSVTAATAEAIERVRSRRESQAQAAAHGQPLDQEAQDRGMPSLTRAHSWNFQQPMAPLCRQQSIHGTPEIFLGGTCGESKWRQEQCIPMLVAARLSYYNPQLGPGEWSPELIPIEAAAKAGALCHLFVITGESRGIGSMIEAAELIATGVATVLCLEPYASDLTDSDDVNRGRKYLRDVAQRHGCAVHDSIEQATLEVIQRVRVHAAPPISQAADRGEASTPQLARTPSWNFSQPNAPLNRRLSSVTAEVFLGGSCGETTWRQQVAIPI